MQFDMIPIAMLGDSSLIIQRTEVERQDKRRAKLTTTQQIALDSLHDVLAKEGSDRCRIDIWKADHRVKTPDLTPGKRRDARAALQSKRVIFIDDGMVIVNRGLS